MSNKQELHGTKAIWQEAFFTFKSHFWSLVAAGFIGCVLCAALLLSPLAPNVYKARAALLLDESSTDLLANVSGNDDSGESLPGLTPISMPTIRELITQPRIAREVIDIILEARDNKIDFEGIRGRSVTMEEFSQMPLKEKIIHSIPDNDVEVLQSYSFKEFRTLSPEDLIKFITAEPKVEKKLAFDVVYSPILYVDATATEPKVARLLTNLWSATFTHFYDQEIGRRQIQENFDFIKREYDLEKQNWMRNQELIQELKTTATLELLTNQYTELKNKHSLVMQNINQLREQLKIAENNFLITVIKVIMLSNGNEWAGTIDTSSANTIAYNAPLAPTWDQLLSQLSSYALPSLDESASESSAGMSSYLEAQGVTKSMFRSFLNERRNIVNIASKYVEHLQDLRVFRQSSQLDYLTDLKADTSTNLIEYKKQFVRAGIDLKAKTEQFNTLEAELSNTSETLRLNKILPTDTNANSQTGMITYEEDILNETFKELDLQKRQLSAEIKSLKAEREETKQTIDRQTLLLEDLTSSLSLLNIKENALLAAYDNYSEVYDTYNKKYDELKLQESDESTSIVRLNANLIQLQNTERELTQEFIATEPILINHQNEIIILQSELKENQVKTERLRGQLFYLKSLLSNSRQIKIASFAIIPEEKIWPPRSLLTLIGGIVLSGIYFIYLLTMRVISGYETSGSA
jgi:hypothetical protein